MMEAGGNIIDHHGCDFFPERWFDGWWFSKLTTLGHTGQRLTNNIERGIFQIFLEEAKESYPENIVVALRSDSVEGISKNVEMLSNWDQ
ncbi:unnamed protein product [Withania somnifera]